MKKRVMAITINLAGTDYRLLGRVFAGLITGVLLLVFSMGAMVWTAVSHRSLRVVVEKKINELAASEEKVRPLLVEREQLVKDITAMSGLMEARRFSWTRLLTDLEAAVPIGVALSTVDFNPKDGSLALDGTAQSPESLRNLMVGLEKSRSFTDPLLKHQSIDKGNISFNVGAFYHEDVAGRASQATARPQGKQAD